MASKNTMGVVSG